MISKWVRRTWHTRVHRVKNQNIQRIPNGKSKRNKNTPNFNQNKTKKERERHINKRTALTGSRQPQHFVVRVASIGSTYSSILYVATISAASFLLSKTLSQPRRDASGSTKQRKTFPPRWAAVENTPNQWNESEYKNKQKETSRNT